MPINPSALSSSAPEPEKLPGEPDISDQTLDRDRQPLEQRRKRRTKAEMIAAAVVPGMDDKVEIKDSGSGAKIERPWRVAVEMFRDKRATWLDKPQEYAFLKYEQQRASSAFSQDAAAAHSDVGEDPANPKLDPDITQKQDVRYVPDLNSHMVKIGQENRGDRGVYVTIEDIHGGHRMSMELSKWESLPTEALTHGGLENDASGQFVAPDGAELGDEVVVGPDTYTVGHDRALVKGVVAKDGEIVHAKRRWKREIGDPNGPFVAEQLSRPSIEQRAGALEQGASNGKADGVTVETERLPRQVEQVSDGDDGVLKWKIGNGILEKIGLPDYSSLQVGPISASRMVVDDGRRVVVELNDGRSGEVPTAVIEAFEEIDNVVEYIASRFRGQLQAFLQATGALKQPVS